LTHANLHVDGEGDKLPLVHRREADRGMITNLMTHAAINLMH
jgi:hypothetical protein